MLQAEFRECHDGFDLYRPEHYKLEENTGDEKMTMKHSSLGFSKCLPGVEFWARKCKRHQIENKVPDFHNFDQLEESGIMHMNWQY